MTIRVSKETRAYIAQCDKCFDVVDFEKGVEFDAVKLAIDMDGWKTQRSNGSWINVCPDCQ